MKITLLGTGFGQAHAGARAGKFKVLESATPTGKSRALIKLPEKEPPTRTELSEVRRHYL